MKMLQKILSYLNFFAYFTRRGVERTVREETIIKANSERKAEILAKRAQIERQRVVRSRTIPKHRGQDNERQREENDLLTFPTAAFIASSSSEDCDHRSYVGNSVKDVTRILDKMFDESPIGIVSKAGQICEIVYEDLGLEFTLEEIKEDDRPLYNNIIEMPVCQQSIYILSYSFKKSVEESAKDFETIKEYKRLLKNLV